MALQQHWDHFAAKIARWLGEKSEKDYGVSQQTMDRAVYSELFERYEKLHQNLPYESYDAQNRLFINKNSIGFMLEASPLTGASEETEKILQSLLTDVLPKDADVQFLLWASNKIGPVLTAFEQARSGRGEIFELLAKKRTAYLAKGTLKSLSSGGTLLLRDFRLFIVVSLPRRKSLAEQKSQLLEVRENYQSSLKSVSMITGDISLPNFMSVLRDLLSPSLSNQPADAHCSEFDSLSEQLTDSQCLLRVEPERLTFEKSSVDANAERVAERWDVRSFTVNKFPQGPWSQWRMNDGIGQLFNSTLQMPCPFVISLSVRVQDYEKSVAKAQLKYLDNDKTARSPLAKFKPNMGKEYRDWELVRKGLAEGDRVVKVFFQIITFAPEGEGNRAERKVRDLYQANGWKLKREDYVQFQSFLAMLPMMVSDGMYHDLKVMGRLRTMLASNAITVAPLQGEWKGLRSPSLLLPGRRGQLATWDPFDNQEGNYNAAIAAMSGSGKSVFMQEYIVALVGSGGRVWVIDVGRSYEKTCRLLNGVYVEFTQKEAININPFTFIKDARQFNEEALELLKPLAAAMARPSGQTSDEENAWLEKALKGAWEKAGKAATMTTVAEWLDQQSDPVCKNLAHLLYPYSKNGMYGRYFEGPCSIDLNNNFIVLELEELKAKKDLQRIVLLVLMYQITQRMFLGDRWQKKTAVIDEAWDLLEGSSGKFIETGYRRARRYRGNFVTVTQSVNDYFKNAMSLAAFENSAFKIILAQTAESLAEVRKNDRLAMDNFTEELLKSLRKTDEYSECVIKNASGGLSVHRIVLDPFARILYSSKGDEFEAVKRLQAQGLSLHAAVEIVAKKFEN